MAHDPLKDSLPTIAKEQGLLPLLKAAILQIDAVGTGAVGTQWLQLLMIPGRLVQAARNKSFVEQLAREFEALREKGRLRSEFERSPEGKSSLQELLAALENPPVDDTKFEALKNIFIAAATGSTSATVPPQLVLSVARTLSSGELIVLATAHRIAREDPDAIARAQGSVHAWIAEIAKVSKIGVTGLVEHYATQLADKNLIAQRTYSDRSGMTMGKHFGLTDFGVCLCELMEHGAAESARTAHATV